jgi:ketosteroid isomerase-like protein
MVGAAAGLSRSSLPRRMVGGTIRGMPIRPAGARSFTGSPDDVEAAFYDALNHADLDRLMACWAEDDDIVCVPPGGPRLVGAGAIRQLFEEIFAHGQLQVQTVAVHKMQTLASATYSTLERVQVQTQDGLRHAVVIATSVYHHTPQGWRLVLHHASPGTPQELVHTETRGSAHLH